MITEDKKYRFSLKTIVIVLFTILTISIGATYALISSMISDKNEALNISLRDKEKKIDEQRKEIHSLKQNKNHPLEATTTILVDTTGNIEIDKLKRKITVLESERNNLLNELVSKSYDELNPKSELSILINGLNSDSIKTRRNAVQGLFILKDPMSINALVNYFFSNQEEATYNKILLEWIWLITDLNEQAGLDFMLELLKNDDERTSKNGFERLMENVKKKEKMQVLIKKLQPIALNHQNTLVRTRAKILIKEYTYIIEGKKEIPDNRGMFRVLLDIEKKIDKMNK